MTQIANLAAVNAVALLAVIVAIISAREPTASKIARVSVVMVLVGANAILALKIWMTL